MRNRVDRAGVELAYLSRNELQADNVLTLIAARAEQLHPKTDSKDWTARRDEIANGLVQAPLVHSAHRCVKRSHARQDEMRQRPHISRRIHYAMVVSKRVDRVGYRPEIADLEIDDADLRRVHFSRYHMSKSQVFLPGVIASKSG